MTDAVFDFTDSTKTPFVVKPYTTNGTLTPANTIPLQPLAVQANTSLVFIGKGVTEYGELVQQNLLYLLEHFANDTPPAYPIEGQAWFNNTTDVMSVYYGGVWHPVVQYDNVTQDIDMAGFAISSLADATLPTDALNLQTGDARYVNASGDTVTGTLTLSGGSTFIISPNAPTLPNHLANKDYVDGAVSSVGAGIFVAKAGDTMTGFLTLFDDPTIPLHAATKQYVDDSIIASTGSIGTLFVAKTGDTMTGTLTISTGDLVVSTGSVTTPNLVLTTGGVIDVQGTTDISMGLNRVKNVADPTTSQDAATKFYVDDTLSAGSIVSGYLDGFTSQIILERPPGYGDVTVTGAVAPLVHTHSSPTINHVVPPSSINSYIRSQLFGVGSYPANQLYDILNALDEALYALNPLYLHREVLVQTVPGTTTFTLGKTFTVGSNRLAVHINGQKQYADQYAIATVPISPQVTLDADTTLLPSTSYSFDIVVDGVAYVGVTITTGVATTTYADLLSLIAAELSLLTAPVTLTFIDSAYTFISHTSGTGSEVTITDVTLFAAVAGAGAPINNSITVDYSYFEVGNTLSTSNSFTFHVAPAVGAVVEVIILPGR